MHWSPVGTSKRVSPKADKGFACQPNAKDAGSLLLYLLLLLFDLASLTCTRELPRIQPKDLFETKRILSFRVSS
jgi:hypothetical protein